MCCVVAVYFKNISSFYVEMYVSIYVSMFVSVSIYVSMYVSMCQCMCQCMKCVIGVTIERSELS